MPVVARILLLSILYPYESLQRCPTNDYMVST
jgi:hypothetical protein